MQIGIPSDVAMTLSFAEKVTEFNCAELRILVMRGVDKHPGAVAVENSKGNIINLRHLDEEVCFVPQ